MAGARDDAATARTSDRATDTGADTGLTGGTGLDLAGFARRHAADLHRTALMLTADPDRADRLVREVLPRAAGEAAPAGGPGARDPEGVDRARELLVRDYLKQARRHRWDRPAVAREGDGDGADAGDVLAALTAKQRAVAVLVLVHEWTPQQVARAVRVTPSRVAELTPRAVGLADALQGVADRHARPAPELVDELVRAVRAEMLRTPRGLVPRLTLSRPWRWLVAAALVLVLAATAWALDRADTSGSLTGPAPDPDGVGMSLSDRGWVLGADGKAPRDVDGLQLLDVRTIDYSKTTAPLEVKGGDGSMLAKFAVLWCDLPAVDDSNLVIPTLTLSFAEGSATLPCAGRAGQPPVTQLTPVPYGESPVQDVGVSWDGDLPGRGHAVLAFYHESLGGGVYGSPPLGSDQSNSPAPHVAPGAVALSREDASTRGWMGRTYVQRVDIGQDSSILAWAGSSVALSIMVDGYAVTDDGDLHGWSEPSRGVDAWRTQDADLRDGAWVVREPAQSRTFDLPETVRPAAGGRRTAVVTVLVHGDVSDDRHWQVQIADASEKPFSDSQVPIAASPQGAEAGQPIAPEFFAGAQRLARWELPADGYAYDLELPSESLELAQFVTALPPDRDASSLLMNHNNVGSVQSDFGTAPMYPSYNALDAFSFPEDGPWVLPRSESLEPGRLRVALPVLPGQPALSVWAYVPVDYEDFDFTDAPPSVISWPADEEPPFSREDRPVTTVTDAGIRKDGVITFDEHVRGRTAWITTHGKGRLRLLIDGEPVVDLEPQRDGWWSSWTDAHVTTEVYLPDAVAYAQGKLSIEVEGYEEGLRIEMFSDFSR